MGRQSQCSVGSNVSSNLGSLSLNWEPARLQIPIWIIIVILLQGMVPVSRPHKSLHQAPGLSCSQTHSGPFNLQHKAAPLVLHCAFSPVKPRIQEVRCPFTLFWQSVSCALHTSVKSLLRTLYCYNTVNILNVKLNWIHFHLAAFVFRCTWERPCEARVWIWVQITSHCGTLRCFIYSLWSFCAVIFVVWKELFKEFRRKGLKDETRLSDLPFSKDVTSKERE